MPSLVDKRLKSYETRLKELKERTENKAHPLIDRRTLKQMTKLEKKVGLMKDAIAEFEEDFCDKFPELPDPKAKPTKIGGLAVEQIALLIFLLLFIGAVVVLLVMFNVEPQ